MTSTVPTSASPSSGPDAEAAHDAVLQLDVGGMTCAACAGRVERALNKIDGARATVNLATERATVTGIRDVDVALAAVRKAGYEAREHETDSEWSAEHAQHRVADLRRRLLVAAVLTVPLMDFTLALALVPGLRFPHWDLLSVAVAIPVVTWCAAPFHRVTWENLRHGALTMETLVSLGIVVSFGWAAASVLFDLAGDSGFWIGFGDVPPGADALYLDVAAGLVTFQLAGRYFETRSRRRAVGVLDALGRLAAPEARVVRDGAPVVVPTQSVLVGESVVVLPGETVPLDGTVTAGIASIDTAPVTGESSPRTVQEGDSVIGGTLDTDGRIVVEVTAVGANTQLAQMVALAEEAQERKATIQRLVDGVVRWFVPVVIVLATVTFLAWLLSGAPLGKSVAIGIAVLIIACPCALGLATPMALMVGVGRGASLGILVRGQDAFEASGRIDTVVLDKTGTLTTGRMSVVEVRGVAPSPDDVPSDDVVDEALALAAAVESGSTHPVAEAVVTHVVERGLPVPDVDEVEARAGRGVRGLVDGRRVDIGTPDLMHELGHDTTLADALVDDQRAHGRTVAVVAVDGVVRAVVGAADGLKESAVQTVRDLTDLGLEVVLLTGDHRSAAAAIGDQLGIEHVMAEVLPTEKAAVVTTLQESGRTVAMVGDGINDVAALATADLGLALASGTDVAMRSADVILVRDDLGLVPDSIRLSRATLRTIRGNLVWAVGYNVAAIPIAVAGFLNPLIAAACMACSSLFVVQNSLRLNRFQPRRTDED